MASNETMFVITGDGRMARWDIKKQEVDFNTAVVRQISATSPRQLIGVLPGQILKGGYARPINLTLGNGYAVWSVELGRIPMEAPFATAENGKVVYPAFADKDVPLLKMVWQVPDNMRLVLAICLTDNKHALSAQHLIAYDNSGRTFRLPIANLYDDCKLCHGNYDGSQRAATQFHGLELAWQQWNNGRWNADLFKSDSVEGARNLFAFNVEKDKFVQRWEQGKDWTQWCRKVGVEYLNTNVIINPAKE